MDYGAQISDRRRWCFASFLASALVLFLFWFAFVRGKYSPIDDDVALFAASTRPFHPVIHEWFTRGFHGYFTFSSDLIRPVVNGSLYIASLFCGSRWANYLLINYVAVSALVGAITYVGRRHFGVAGLQSICVSVLVFFAPAVQTASLVSPAFAYDVVSATFVVIGLALVLESKLALAWMFFTLGVFTKETAIFAPACIAVLFFSGVITPQSRKTNRFLVGSMFLVPLILWLTLRLAAFHGKGEVYAIMPTTPLGYVKTAIGGLLNWPVSPLLARSRRCGLLWAVNLSFWLTVLYVLSGFLVSNLRRKVFAGLRTASGQRVIALCAAGSFVMPVAMNLPQRFHVIDFAMLTLVLMAASRYVRSRALRYVIGGVLFVLALCEVAALRAEGSYLRRIAPRWEYSRNYFATLHESAASTIYLLDDIVAQTSAPSSVARFSGFTGKLKGVSRASFPIDPPPACAGEPIITMIHADETGQTIVRSSLVDRCGVQFDLQTGARPAPVPIHIYEKKEQRSAGLVSVHVLEFSVPDSDSDTYLLVPVVSTRSYKLIPVSTLQQIP